MNNPPYIIRPLHPDEVPLLSNFLYEAIYVPQGVETPPRSIVDLPELRIYIEEFGARHGDHCLVAEVDGQVIGASWARLMNDYGHVDDQTPSLAISLLPSYRGHGIGTALFRSLLSLLSARGFSYASLSVQKANPAVRLYQRLNFHTVRETEEEYIMLCQL